VLLAQISNTFPQNNHKRSVLETQAKKNKERDKLKAEKLQAKGWAVMRFWEHELTDCRERKAKAIKYLHSPVFQVLVGFDGHR
jgi:very-short-patch-repair endonuclease